MDYPNISLVVKHDTSKQGKTFSDEAYKAMRNQLSNLVRNPFIKRVKDIWCENQEHHTFLTEIIINADDYKYEVVKVCCEYYKTKLIDGLLGVEKDV